MLTLARSFNSSSALSCPGCALEVDVTSLALLRHERVQTAKASLLALQPLEQELRGTVTAVQQTNEVHAFAIPLLPGYRGAFNAAIAPLYPLRCGNSLRSLRSLGCRRSLYFALSLPCCPPPPTRSSAPALRPMAHDGPSAPSLERFLRKACLRNAPAGFSAHRLFALGLALG